MQSPLFQAIAWISARHIRHFEANKVLVAQIGAWLMRLSDRDAYDYNAARIEQHETLHELKALSAAFDIKALAGDGEFWEDQHGIGLDMVSGVLIERHDWHPEEVARFVEELSDGFFSFADFDEEP